jgi:hypothetical protein
LEEVLPTVLVFFASLSDNCSLLFQVQHALEFLGHHGVDSEVVFGAMVSSLLVVLFSGHLVVAFIVTILAADVL